jgi:hypothetical protein
MITSNGGPTAEAYGELQRAFDYYNNHLFDAKLPPCLITLHRGGKNTYGIFAHRRFVKLTDESQSTDEIAMNPVHFTGRSLKEILSTMVHEMAHLWQAHYAEPSRKTYHNKEWSEKMKSIGLHPSDSGIVGGKETGQTMDHYVIEGGKFDTATEALINQGFKLTWADYQSKNNDAEEKETKSGKRLKYGCPKCKNNAWGKSSLNIICGSCLVPYLPHDKLI